MKKFQYTMMAIAFLSAGVAACMYYSQGLGYWVWPVVTMLWIGDSFIKQRTLDKLEK
jgi:uncharacterized membrane protein